MLRALGNMSVTVEKNVTILKRRKIAFVEVMTVSHINKALPCSDYGIIRKNREIKHHLVNLRVTITSDTKDFTLHCIQNFNYFFRRIALGQIVSRSVIKNIAEENDSVRLFVFVGLNQLFAIKFRAVNIGGN